MIRFELKSTVLRLFNTKEGAASVARLHGGDFTVYFLNNASGFFFVNDKGIFDEDGKISKYLKNDETDQLFKMSQKV